MRRSRMVLAKPTHGYWSNGLPGRPMAPTAVAGILNLCSKASDRHDIQARHDDAETTDRAFEGHRYI